MIYLVLIYSQNKFYYLCATEKITITTSLNYEKITEH